MKRSVFFKYSVILLFSFLFLLNNAKAGDLLQPGEELLYEVSFLGVKLGSIKMITEKDATIDNVSTYKVKGLINTYKGIPFVDIHAVYQSWMDKSVTYSHRFNATLRSNGYWDLHKIFFNYKKDLMYVSKENKDGKYFSKTYRIKDKYNDGLSLFFLARKYLYLGRTISIPTIVDRDTVRTYINFHNKRENIEFSGANYHVRTIYFNGKAAWTGIYGLSGGFEGWFSDDEARIPIKAKMNVYVGNILIELKQWRRKGWAPPRAY